MISQDKLSLLDMTIRQLNELMDALRTVDSYSDTKRCLDQINCICSTIKKIASESVPEAYAAAMARHGKEVDCGMWFD